MTSFWFSMQMCILFITRLFFTIGIFVCGVSFMKSYLLVFYSFGAGVTMPLLNPVWLDNIETSSLLNTYKSIYGSVILSIVIFWTNLSTDTLSLYLYMTFLLILSLTLYLTLFFALSLTLLLAVLKMLFPNFLLNCSVCGWGKKHKNNNHRLMVLNFVCFIWFQNNKQHISITSPPIGDHWPWKIIFNEKVDKVFPCFIP